LAGGDGRKFGPQRDVKVKRVNGGGFVRKMLVHWKRAARNPLFAAAVWNRQRASRVSRYLPIFGLRMAVQVLDQQRAGAILILDGAAGLGLKIVAAGVVQLALGDGIAAVPRSVLVRRGQDVVGDVGEVDAVGVDVLAVGARPAALLLGLAVLLPLLGHRFGY